MGSKFFEELSRCLGKEQIESLSKEDRRLEIFLHGQPVLSVSPGNEVFTTSFCTAQPLGPAIGFLVRMCRLSV